MTAKPYKRKNSCSKGCGDSQSAGLRPCWRHEAKKWVVALAQSFSKRKGNKETRLDRPTVLYIPLSPAMGPFFFLSIPTLKPRKKGRTSLKNSHSISLGNLSRETNDRKLMGEKKKKEKEREGDGFGSLGKIQQMYYLMLYKQQPEDKSYWSLLILLGVETANALGYFVDMCRRTFISLTL